jgi:nucleoside-diphosphate-sugar epimerase
MGPTGGAVRSGRSGPTVAVTPAGSAVGAALVRALTARIGAPGGPRAVVAVVDEAATDLFELPEGAEVRHADVATPAVAAALTGADVVVHVAAATDLAADLRAGATGRRARAVRAVQEVAGGAAAAGARRLLVVTSAAVHGADAGNPVPLPEDAPLRTERDEGVIGDLLEVERVVARLPRVHPRLACTVLRPAALVGPGVDTFITRHFETRRLLCLRGHEMRWQFCHIDDLGSAVAVAVEHDLTGPLTVGGGPWLTTAQVEELTGMRRIELPPAVAFGTAQRLHRRRLLHTPAGYLAYVVHPWVVDAARLTAAGWQPRYTVQECLAVLVAEIRAQQTPAARAASARRAEGRADGRIEGREAALGAAGAAVAVVGAAALLRQARSRRGPGRRGLR